MKRCTRCLYPDTKPDLHFDDAGVCSACRAFDKRKTIDWPARQSDLEAILASGKNDSGYDCIVPSSGGKDSHWQVIKLVEMGFRPLVVTATTCHLTAMGRANIDNLSKIATTMEVTPNRKVRATLNRLGLRLVGDISWPEHVAIFTIPFQVATALGIPLIFYGECPQEAYGGPPGTDEAREMTLRWVSEFGGFNGLRPVDLIGQNGLTDEDMIDYLMPPPDRISAVGVRSYFLGQFFEWDSHRNAEVAIAHGMTCALPSPANWWPWENLDNAQTGIHDYMMFLKYGYGRLVAQIGVDIRKGMIRREDAFEVMRARDGLYPDVYAGVRIAEVLDNIRMTRAQFDGLCGEFRCSPAA